MRFEQTVDTSDPLRAEFETYCWTTATVGSPQWLA